MTVQLNNKGLSTCLEQVTSKVKDEVRYSSNNAWIVNLNNGNVNNNNTYNRYNVCGASELSFDIDEWLDAERECFKNKHGSKTAQRLHIHRGKIWKIAASVSDGSYKPLRSYCFVLSYPVFREIFAAYPSDRIVHHYIAPFISSIAEKVHKANGDVSHGNRIGHSAYTYAKQVRDNILASGADCIVANMDIRGFFMSIPRQQAYDILEKDARQYYDGYDLEEKLTLCHKVIMHDPTQNCLRVGDVSQWDMVATNKSLFNAKDGCGLPIGNFPSQLIANLYLAELDRCLIDCDVKVSRFVDDITVIGKSIDAVNKARRAAYNKASELGLQLHPKKYFVQPAHRGIKSCGYSVKGKRIYLNNRTINHCFDTINRTPANLPNARKLMQSINSYLGFLRHCTEHKTEKRIAAAVLSKFGEWLTFTMKLGHYVCQVKQEYSERYNSFNFCNQLIQSTNESRKISERCFRSQGDRRPRKLSCKRLQASV